MNMSSEQKKVDRIGRKPFEPKIWSYARWSSEAQTDGDSQRRQLQASQDWCSRRGLTLAGSAEDSGVSAYHGKNHDPKSELSQLLKRMTPGDVLLIEDNDRFSRRDPITAMNALKSVVDRGVKVNILKTGVEVTAENFNDPNILFPNFFQSWLGNAESVKKAGRVKASWDARKAAVANGTPLNQNLPSWLKWDAQAKKVVLVPERVAIVKQI